LKFKWLNLRMNIYSILIAELDRELLERYPEETVFGLDFTDPKI